jgi:hypothetical protein
LKRQSTNWEREEVRSSLPEFHALINVFKGIYGPGYQERRAERIKEKYGIEVPTKS